jgi:hypothetical protein
METEKIYNLMILDESGSMDSIKKATIQGFNEVVQNIKGIQLKFPEQQHYISLVTFNGLGIKTILDKQPVTGLNLLDENSYKPDSMTPLYDAIGTSVLKLKNDISGVNNATVLVTIITDGMENDSGEFKGPQIKQLIENQQAAGWTFTYIGANQNVEYEAAHISISNTLTFFSHDEGVKEMFEKENQARQRFSQKIRNKEEKSNGFYKP